MFTDFKPVLMILLRFVVIYLALLGVYQLYLNSQAGDLDSFSKTVGEQSTWIQNKLGYPSKFIDDPKQETGWFYVNGNYISRMVEGCNAVSVMILFVSFIFAFYSGLKTFVFAFLGLVFLYVVNVFRIAWLNIIIIKFPQYSEIGHQYFFPAIIYGSVVILWLIWIKFFAIKKNETA